MTRAEEYRYLADSVRARARTADSWNLANEWEQLAECYALLAKQAERNEKANQTASKRDKERLHN